MKNFDNFEAWILEEKKYIKQFKEVPDYANFIYQQENTEKQKWTYKIAMKFYMNYYYLGNEFLLTQIETLRDYPSKKNLIRLVKTCSFLNESLIELFKEKYFPFIKNKATQSIIVEYMPVCQETISLYVNKTHTDILTFIDAISAMLIIDYNESNRKIYRDGGDIFSFLSGDIFNKLFQQILSHPSPSIKTTLPKIKSRFSYYYSVICEEDINDNEFLYEKLKEAMKYEQNKNIVTWRHVLFQNGYFLIFHPKHPDGQGKYKPFRMSCSKSVKAFNHVKEYILKKLPPIEVEYEDDIIVEVKPSCLDSIEDAIITLSKHTSAPIVKIEGQKESRFTHLRSGNYTNKEAKEALRQLKSQYLDYLSTIHNDTDKLYYCIEKRINSSATPIEEDAFFFSIKSNSIYTLLAFENTLPSRATILFTCKNNELNKAIDFIHDYFSSPEINKREKFLVKKLNLLEHGIVRYERVLHDSYASWLAHIERTRKAFNY